MFKRKQILWFTNWFLHYKDCNVSKSYCRPLIKYLRELDLITRWLFTKYKEETSRNGKIFKIQKCSLTGLPNLDCHHKVVGLNHFWKGTTYAYIPSRIVSFFIAQKRDNHNDGKGSYRRIWFLKQILCLFLDNLYMTLSVFLM